MSHKKAKISVINRDEATFTRERSQDIMKVYRNPDPNQHQFQRAREYTRALNATKLDKYFSKPFICALEGHSDGVYEMSRVPNSLSYVVSGDGDGEVKLWHIGYRRQLWTAKAHEARVRGITVDPYGQHALTCSADKTIKMFKLDSSKYDFESYEVDDNGYSSKVHVNEAVNVFTGKHNFSGIDHHRAEDMFATSGVQVDLWDKTRANPVHSFQWGADSVLSVKFNYVDTNVLLSSASDRNLVLYDVRSKTPLRKLIMEHMTNAIAWNPMESYHFVAANEDSNLYSFDMRNLDKALQVHRDHVSAVLHVDFSPTGKEFASAGYDRMIRLWNHEEAKSRDCYHTKRMQKVMSVLYSQDSKYVVSGSDDTNLRLWKANATERMGTLLNRQVESDNYKSKLKERYANAPEIRAIRNQKILPTSVKHSLKVRKESENALARRMGNVTANTGVVPEEAKNLKERKVVRIDK